VKCCRHEIFLEVTKLNNEGIRWRISNGHGVGEWELEVLYHKCMCCFGASMLLSSSITVNFEVEKIQ
jgi:hypothetical protein